MKNTKIFMTLITVIAILLTTIPVNLTFAGTIGSDNSAVNLDTNITTTPVPTVLPGAKYRVATTHVRPFSGSLQGNMDAVQNIIEKTVQGCHPDIILLSEMVYQKQSGAGWLGKAEAVPGPYSEMISAECSKYGVNIIFNMLQQRDDGKYNTDILMDRNGNIVGQYDKMHLVAGPDEGNFTTPGSDYTVLDTEFGKIGFQICYDLDPQFDGIGYDELVNNGAKLIFVSTEGEYWPQAQEYAKRDNVYTVVSGQDKYLEANNKPVPISAIFDNNGGVVASTDAFITNSVATGTYTYADILPNDPLGTASPSPGEPTATPSPTVTITSTPSPTPVLSETPSPTPTYNETPSPTPANVIDMDGLLWAKQQVESLVNRGIISGKSVTEQGILFAPRDQVTRAEITKLIVKAFGIEGSGSDANFSDVTSDKWYYDVIGAAYKDGIINGTSTTTFDPDAPVTRQDMCKIIVSAMNKHMLLQILDSTQAESQLSGFADAGDISDYARVYIATAANIKLILGYNEGDIIKFKPLAYTTRAEAAVVIYRMLSDK